MHVRVQETGLGNRRAIPPPQSKDNICSIKVINCLMSAVGFLHRDRILYIQAQERKSQRETKLQK